MLRTAYLTGLCLTLGGAGWAADEFTSVPAKKEAPAKTVCELIDASAAAHKLPVVFFTRLIWKESRFRAGAVSPKGAQGIAQFMPGTAALRGLADPFNPAVALPASAHYLRDLRAQFGNLGLAAAAYNAGEKRVTDWLAGTTRLPWETQDYVLFITGRTAEDWADGEAGPAETEAAPRKCDDIAKLLSTGAGAALVSTTPQESAPWAPWGVQVAGNFSTAAAMRSYRSLQQRYPSLLGGQAPMILRAVLKSRGRAPFTEVRVPFGSRAEADTLCAKLRKAGGACVVAKTAGR